MVADAPFFLQNKKALGVNRGHFIAARCPRSCHGLPHQVGEAIPPTTPAVLAGVSA